ncbi:MAG: hypothetical protein K5842_03245 [Bacteroidales bacterium]|nr:hypothetical protein [Bacteroidales bacterium]
MNNNNNDNNRNDRNNRNGGNGRSGGNDIDIEKLEVPVVPQHDEDAATAEEMEEFIRSRRERRSSNHRQHYEEVDPSEVPIDPTANENAMDPYLEPDPTLPKVRYDESLYLSRGCNHCPESYVPVSETELRSCCKVGSCNWMRGIRQPMEKPFDCVEVRFKNNRKDFFRIPDGIDVSDGDVVAVEGMPGHDVGIVSLTGEVCRIQMMKKKVDPNSENIRKLFRRAKASDIERWTTAIKEEENTLKKTRQISEDLGLVMKVNDVEYQGDHSKAIFYYTADDRVDFRALIKVLAEQFHVRIEMKQIGVRQEAGKVGGIGTCGRELCCSTWLTNFKSVTTGVAKAQQILPNPQKLAGQCGKLKCCLNFEYSTYIDALKNFPPANTPIRFKKGLALYKKTDVFRGIMWYAYEGENDLYALKAEDVKSIIEMNRNAEYPEQLEDYQVELMSTAALAQESSNDEFERELQLLADENTTEQSTRAQDNRKDVNDRRRNGEPRRGQEQSVNKKNNGEERRQENSKPRKGPEHPVNKRPNGEERRDQGGNKPRGDRQKPRKN